MEQWEKDQSFKAQEGQEVEKAIYWEMLEALPLKSLPTATAGRVPGIVAGFLVGEPAAFNNNGLTFDAFGKTEAGKYYYLGESNTARALGCAYLGSF